MERTKIGKLLQTKVYVQIGEILSLFVVALAIINLFETFVKDSLILKQGSVWLANIAMLIIFLFG